MRFINSCTAQIPTKTVNFRIGPTDILKQMESVNGKTLDLKIHLVKSLTIHPRSPHRFSSETKQGTR